jgi:hypothetical protein
MRIVEQGVEQLRGHALALGRLGAELDQFPKEHYCSLCDRVFEFLQVHTLNR